MATATCISPYEAHGAREDILKFLEGEFLRIYSSDKHADIMGFVPTPRLLHQLVEKSEGYFVSCHKVVVVYDLKHLYRLYREFGRDMNRTESIIQPISSSTEAQNYNSDLSQTDLADLYSIHSSCLGRNAPSRSVLLAICR